MIKIVFRTKLLLRDLYNLSPKISWESHKNLAQNKKKWTLKTSLGSQQFLVRIFTRFSWEYKPRFSDQSRVWKNNPKKFSINFIFYFVDILFKVSGDST